MTFMIKTVVCKKEGCSGNEFYIQTINNKLKITCRECNTEILLDANSDGYLMLSKCSKCNNKMFKLFNDENNNKIYAKCTKCGAPPEIIYIDEDGIQVSYESKILQSIKELINKVDQRVYNLEIKVDAVEKGQDILEESLAYINKYIVESKN